MMEQEVDWKKLMMEEHRRAVEEVAHNMDDDLRIRLAALDILNRHRAAFEELAK